MRLTIKEAQGESGHYRSRRRCRGSVTVRQQTIVLPAPSW